MQPLARSPVRDSVKSGDPIRRSCTTGTPDACAFVLPQVGGTDLNVVYGTAAEFTALGGTANLEGCGTKDVNGTVANVGASEIASISLGFSSTSTFPGNPGPPAFPAFVLHDVAEGSLDLVATRADLATLTGNKAIIRRNQNILNNGSLASLDFNAEGFVPGTANVTVTGLGSDQASVISSFAGVYGSKANGTLSIIQSYTSASGAQPFAAVPLLQLVALELNQLTVFAPDAANSFAARTAGVYFRTPADKTIAVGPAISTPTVTKLVTAPNARPRVQLASQPLYNRLINASYQQANGRDANVFATAGYFGAAPATWDITLPDLSGAAGWSTTWGLLDGTGIEWTVSVQGGAVQFLDANSIIDGDTFRSASIRSSSPLNLGGARAAPDSYSIATQLHEALREQNRSPLR